MRIGHAALTIQVALVCACSRAPEQVSGPGSFHIESLGSTKGGASRYLLSVGTCRFELKMAQARPASDPRFSFAEAGLVRQPGADCTPFLRGLAPELGFKGELPTPAPAERIAATIAVLATNQSRGDLGGFSSTPAGHWMATKLFLADGEGEVYLNINPTDGVGEFSIKDEDYAKDVVTELARVMLPAAGTTAR